MMTYKIYFNQEGDTYLRTGLFHFDPDDDIGKVHDFMETVADYMCSPKYNIFMLELIDEGIDDLVKGKRWKYAREEDTD